MANTQFFKDDINIADYRILLSLWNRETGETDYYVDISSIATTNISITKERNMPDNLEVTIEYTQFKEKLDYEGTSPENILMPFVTEVKIQRNFETVFNGTLFHMSLSLGAVGQELLQLKCCSWGQHYEKRFVSEGFHGTYPEIAQQLVLAGQHEMNWFDNYAWEYTDDYFEGWTWSKTLQLQAAYDAAIVARKAAKAAYDQTTSSSPDRDAKRKAYDDAYDAENNAKEALDKGKKAPRADIPHWEGGLKLAAGESIWTYSMQPANMMGEGNSKLVLKPLHWGFYYKATGAATVKLSGHADNDGNIGTELFSHTENVTASGSWTLHYVTVPSKTINGDIRWLKLTIGGNTVEISDLNLYTEPEQGDAYDLDITVGSIDTQGHRFDNSRVRHYHRQNIKDALYNVAKLVNAEGLDGSPDNFEYEFDEHKSFNIYYRQGKTEADPAFAAIYPGIIKTLTLERGLEELANLEYATAEEEKTFKDSEGNEQILTKRWTSAYSSGGSMNRFGAQVEFKDYESVHSYADLDTVGGSDLNIYDMVHDIPEIEVDSNIYNLGNVHLGDAVTVKVLADPIFQFVNGTYRVYQIKAYISKDAVETIKLTLVPIDIAGLQLISFPKQYKYLKNDVRRLMTGSN